MKKLLMTTKYLLIALSIASVAQASDNNWTGFYIGATGGFGFGNAQLKSQHLSFTSPDETCNQSSDFSTFASGVQLGYLYKFANAFVSGIEANATINAHQEHTFSCTSQFNSNVYDGLTFKNQLQTSIKGRVGHILNWNNNTYLPYLTAGASFANLGLKYNNEAGDFYSKTTTQLGWLIGAGIEWAFLQHWSVRAEYYHVDYGNAIKLNIPSVYGLVDVNGKGKVNLKSNNVMMALNYWL